MAFIRLPKFARTQTSQFQSPMPILPLIGLLALGLQQQVMHMAHLLLIMGELSSLFTFPMLYINGVHLKEQF